MKYRELLELLCEGLSHDLYHTTTLNKLVEILGEDRFFLTAAGGTPSDSDINDGKFYFLSMSRIKFGGYNRSMSVDGMVIIDLDGRKLSYNHTGKSVDYWGDDYRRAASKEYRKAKDDHDKFKDKVSGMDLSGDNFLSRMNKKHYDSSKNSVKGAFDRIIRYDENEDRVLSDKPFIEGASKYIRGIHIMLEHTDDIDDRVSHRIQQIAESATKLGVDIYVYDELKNFKMLNGRGVPIDEHGHMDVEVSDDVKNYERSSLADRKSKYEHMFDILDAKTIDDISEETKEFAYRYNLGYTDRDLVSGINNEIAWDKQRKEKADGVLRLNKLIRQHGGVKEFVDHVGEHYKTLIGE
jgi:hypothetical protein